MVYFLYGLFFLSCLVLIAAVLLQPGKTDAGALFTSNVSSSAFAPRGTATVLSKITIAAAAIFMLSALFLSMPALTGDVSVLGANPETPAEQPASVPVDNTNSALVETPATDVAANQAANAAAANSLPANAALESTNSNSSANKASQ